MRTTFLAASALLLLMSGLDVGRPARAEGRGSVHSHAHVLPPHIPYRDRRVVVVRPRRAPDFLIHAYLPRPTEKPIYNEPPPRAPLW